MDQRQKNTRKMYTNVLQFFLHAGSPLLGIKKIADLVAQATADVAALDAEALRQPADTTGITRTRADVKKEAATKAEALRGLVTELTADTQLQTALRKPVSGYLYGADAAFLTYCQQVVDGLATLDKQDLKDAGYDPAILAVLVADLKALNETTGEAVQMQAAGAAATDNLLPLFAAVDAGLTSLDKFVHFQQFAQSTLVAQYEALRVLPKTPAAHAFRAKGATPYNVPQLAYHLHEEEVPTPTLANTGGRGHEVVFYLGATASSRPRPGQGLLVKNGKKVKLSDYSALGDAATEPYLLVMQTSELAAGGWRVRG
ncbi:MAG: hypothetical protein M3Y54_04360 [Bacteroidota bacterium]|nr:hypothetical protein [Bacteroidota bacterium]